MCMQLLNTSPPPTHGPQLGHDPMSPSLAASSRRSAAGPHPRGLAVAARRGRRRNAAAGKPPSPTARTLAAGLWRLRHAERQESCPRKVNPFNGSKIRSDLGVRKHCRSNGILEKLEVCVGLPFGAMEKATKWDYGHLNNLCEIFSSDGPQKFQGLHHGPPTSLASVVLEAELEKAHTRVRELEAEKRMMRKKLEQFLRKLKEEKALWKSKVQENALLVIVALKEDVRMERKHRRQLEAANTKLMNELAEAKLTAKRYAQNYEMEKKARELMEEACDELTREVEEDQAEVELLRNECLSMREEIEEERRMLQMAEVWREERVQMKLTDAKLILEQKYSQLSNLQAEMESFLGTDANGESNNSALREARLLREAANSIRIHNVKEFNPENFHAPEDVDAVFEGVQRKKDANERYSSASPASNVNSVSPATDIFLERLDDSYANGSIDMENDVGWETTRQVGEYGSCNSIGTSDPSATRMYKAGNASLPNGKGWDGSEITEVHSGASRLSRKKGPSIRRLWRAATSESSKKAVPVQSGIQRNGQSADATASLEMRSTVIAPTSPIEGQYSSSASVNLQRTYGSKGYDGLSRGSGLQKQSLMEKLLEARWDDHKERPRHSVKQKI